jgi:hypothetical protein
MNGEFPGWSRGKRKVLPPPHVIIWLGRVSNNGVLFVFENKLVYKYIEV